MVSIHSECLLFDLRMVRALLRDHNTRLCSDDSLDGAINILHGLIGVIEDASQLFPEACRPGPQVHLGPC